MVKIKGADVHLKRLLGMAGPGIEREATKLVYTLADMHVAEASHLITEGSVSGKNHVPSRPGEPPNEDTGTLRRSGHVEQTGPFKASSVFDAPYAVALELGTSKMAERPFARPAARTVREQAQALAQAAVERIVDGGKL